ncbi:MAG: hypothetical protein A2V66_10120 [Ignavibacteria bacterium RBG_13_36_8]|nr:MAG: hypothetical protein A2V66_10120 [Ignavibacteria bacterium RBG_13_36_8]
MNRLKKIILSLLLFSWVNVFCQSNAWEVYDEMQRPVAGGQIVVANDIIFILGGYSPEVQQNVDWIQKYNPAITGVWKIFGNMLLQRSGLIGFFYNDGIYYCGGTGATLVNSDALEKWNFTQTGSAIKNDINFTRIYSTGKLYNGIFYLIGGNPKNPTTYLPYIVSYNIQSNVVNILENNLYFDRSLPELQMSGIIGNCIYIFGGIVNSLSQDIYRFDTGSNSLEKLTIQLLEPRAAGTAITIQDTREIFIIGGFNESSNSLKTVEIFKIVDSNYEIIQGPELNYSRRALMAGRTTTDIYVMGGYGNDGNVVAHVEKLSLISTDVNKMEEPVSPDFQLSQNYPNPFNSATNIAFSLKNAINISLDIYSVLGEHIKNISKQYLSPGTYSYRWDGKNKLGIPVNSGVYIYKLSAGSLSKSQKMILLK